VKCIVTTVSVTSLFYISHVMLIILRWNVP